LTLLAVAYLALAALEQSSEYWHFGVAYVMLGVGLGLATPPATEAIIEALPLAKQGVASALNDVARELGAAMGIAVLGSAFNSAYRARVGDLAERVPDAVLDVARDSPAAGLEAAARLGPAGVDTSRVVLDAFVHGWRAGMLVALATMVLGVGFVVARAIRREPSEGA
jgi:MFS family permease